MPKAKPSSCTISDMADAEPAFSAGAALTTSSVPNAAMAPRPRYTSENDAAARATHRSCFRSFAMTSP